MNVKLKVKIIEKFGTQYRFAQAAAVSEATVSRVVGGIKGLPLQEEERWAKLLDGKSEELFRWLKCSSSAPTTSIIGSKGTNGVEMMEEKLDVKQLAERLKVHESWVYSHTRRKRPDAIPMIRVGKYCRFIESEVIQWLRSRQDRYGNKESSRQPDQRDRQRHKPKLSQDDG
jgi:predicted DNA-binding transcriptional regulator AlpA